MRLGAPHTGHLTLVDRMLTDYPQAQVLILVGSANLVGVPSAPLSWLARRDLLVRLLVAHEFPLARLVLAPVADVAEAGFCASWFQQLMGAAVGVMGTLPAAYYFGDDYQLTDFTLLVSLYPHLKLEPVHRLIPKSGTELRQALVSQDPLLLDKYQEELALYPHPVQAEIRAICQDV